MQNGDLMSAIHELGDGIEALKLYAESVLSVGDAGRHVYWMAKALGAQAERAAMLAEEVIDEQAA